MAGLQIVGVGLTTIDILIRTGKMPSWDDGGRVRELSMDGGGPVGTGLVAAARLGARVGFIGTRGCDEAGNFLLSLLTRDGIDISRVKSLNVPEQQIILVYVHEKTGERVFGFRDHPLDEARLRLEELDREYITSADYLHIDGAHHAAAIQAAQWMHQVGKPVLFDAAKSDGMDEKARAYIREMVEVTDYLVCGSGFSQALSGIPDRWKAQEAMLKLGPRVVVQTEGDQGSYTLTAEERFHTPIFPVDVLDTTGAGDVFHGAYLVGLLKGWDLRKVATFATAVSALKCTRLGGRVGTPYYAEVISFLRERGVEIE